MVAAARVELARLYVVGQAGGQNVVADAPFQMAVFEARHHLDPLIEIAGHQIGAAEIDLLAASVAEVPDATVLQETSDDAAHADVVADPGDAGPQTADPPHDEVDARTGLRGQAQLLDHVLVAERIYLEDHVRGITLAGPGRFA